MTQHSPTTKRNNIQQSGETAKLLLFVIAIFMFWILPGISFGKTERPRPTRPEQATIATVMAHIQQGRETGDAGYFLRAEKWLKAMPVEGKEAGKILGLRAWIAVFQHRFQEAKILAEQAIKLQPRVPFHYGVLSDASLELGDYDQALEATQMMLDLKPDQAALSRAAHLRDLHGDSEGAIALWRRAIESGAPAAENTAWCQVELGDVYFHAGRLDQAAEQYYAALQTHPGNHRALAHLGRVQAAKQDFEDATQLYQQAIAAVPLPHYHAALGALYLAMSQKDAAKAQFAQVALAAKLDQLTAGQADRDLARFYADHDLNMDEALSLAEAAITKRKDIHTYDVLAWVYFKAGRYAQAEAAMQQALRLGTKNAVFHYHAGRIAQALGKNAAARTHFKTALTQNPYFHPQHAAFAKQQLADQRLAKKGDPS